MVFTHTLTGATDRSSIVRGDVAMVSGTWDAKAVVLGSIRTGGSVVLSHGVSVGSAAALTGTAKMVLHAKNIDADKATKNGFIGVTSIDVANNVSGDWWAIVRQ